MVPLRCGRCGQNCFYREGMRHCPGCAAAIVTACGGCGRDVFFGDRFCMFCAAALTQAPPIGDAPRPAIVPDLPDAEVQAMTALAEAARERAGAARSRVATPAKQHLDQADIDAMFG